jgi:hypothetical protein
VLLRGAERVKYGFEVNAKTAPLVASGQVTLTTPDELEAFIQRTSVNGFGVIRIRSLVLVLEAWRAEISDER